MPVISPPGSSPRSRSWLFLRTAGPVLLIVLATVLAYLPALRGALIWNDSDYVTKPALRSVAGLGRIWFEVGATEQYYPLLHSLFWVEHRLWGQNPFGYHLFNLLVHTGAALLFMQVLRRLAVPGAWVAALLFALHPVHVESVAWITEEKNTVSLLFYLAAALAYLRFDATREGRTYLAAFAWFVLSLLCKTVTVTLPAALLVALWWRRGRLSGRRDVLPLVPWLVAGGAAGLFSSWVERRFIGAEGTAFSLSAPERVLVAGRAFWFYLGKLVWPSGLNFIYPRWTIDPLSAWQWLYPLAAVALAGALWAWRGRSRAPLAALLFFVGSLFPVLGFVNLYGALYSWVWDHWQYLPDLGPLALAGAALHRLGSWAAGRIAGAGPFLALALAAGLGTLAWRHGRLFHDDETLYRGTLARNPDCWMADYNLGVLLSKQPGRLPEAIAQYQAALRARPDLEEAHVDYGNALMTLPGHLEDAIVQFRLARALDPDDPMVPLDLGNALASVPGREREAIAEFEAALRLAPTSAEVHTSLGNVLSGIPGREREALAQYREALRLDAGSADAHYNLALVLAEMPGGATEARAEDEAALRLRPDYPEAHCHLANLLCDSGGSVPEAIGHYEAAIRARPRYLEAHFNLGQALAGLPGRRADAIREFRAVLRIDPGLELARTRLAELQRADAGL